jgi:hypothetical protein
MVNDWFGSTSGPPDYSCGFSGANVSGAGSGVRVMPNRFTWGADNLSLVQLNSTGSGCIEIHTWANADYQAWSQHVGTNRPAVSPADARVLTADTNGDGRDELISVEYRNTSSGMIEMHSWLADYQHWGSHIASNRPAVNPADAEVIAGDTNGDGRDELYLVQYRNTGSGMIEVHGWSGNMQQWISHKATNRSEIDPGTRANPFAEIISADINGNLAQEFLLIEYHGTGSGRVEIHGWSDSLQQWISHRATSQGSY